MSSYRFQISFVECLHQASSCAAFGRNGSGFGPRAVTTIVLDTTTALVSVHGYFINRSVQKSIQQCGR